MERTFLSHRKRRLSRHQRDHAVHLGQRRPGTPIGSHRGRRKYRQADLDAWLAKQADRRRAARPDRRCCRFWPRRSGPGWRTTLALP